MHKSLHSLLILSLLFSFTCEAQDTYSIVALDTATREAGSAGASCVDLPPSYADGFLAEIFPDTGAIVTQAAYQPANQQNARNRMRAGDDAQAIINYLENNDLQGTPQIRQYGIVRFNGNSAQAKAFTGTNCTDYKNHITGSIDGFHYSIQGNILLGHQVLAQMENNFRNTKGDLACRLMAAMQGAKIVGADTRCAANNTSSLFAFLKVSKATDAFGQPSLLVAMRTREGQQIEPVDSLQKLFDAKHPCSPLGVGHTQNNKADISIFPNPSVSGQYTIAKGNISPVLDYTVCNLLGIAILKGRLDKESSVISLQNTPKGMYLIYFRQEGKLLKTERLLIR